MNLASESCINELTRWHAIAFKPSRHCSAPLRFELIGAVVSTVIGVSIEGPG